VNARDMWGRDLVGGSVLSRPPSGASNNDENDSVPKMEVSSNEEDQAKMDEIWEGLNCAFGKSLRNKKFRKFCRHEWFTSALDRLYFSQNEFMECLYESGFGQITKLTRQEWSHIRSVMGRPRRLSRAFLKEEREKLNRYRTVMRKVQNGVSMDSPLATDIDEFPFQDEVPAKLKEGQTVTAVHPDTKEMHTGVITKSHSKGIGATDKASGDYHYFVKFDQKQLGTVLVSDAAIMPCGNVHSSHSSIHHKVGPPFPHGDGDIHMLSNLLRLLDRKEALVTHLRTMNDQSDLFKEMEAKKEPSNAASEGAPKQENSGDSTKVKQENTTSPATKMDTDAKKDTTSGTDKKSPPKKKDSEFGISSVFKLQYAWVVVQLKNTSTALDNALQALRMRQSGISFGENTSELSYHISTLCYQRARELVSLLCKKMVKRGEISAKMSTISMPGSKINNLIVCCMSLILLIQFCADRGLQPMGLESVLESVRNTSPENKKHFQTIQDCVVYMRSILSSV